MPGKWTPERREKQRQVALRQVAEGNFGGAGRGQGRKRKPRHSEVVADEARNQGKRIYKRLISIVDSGSDQASMGAIDRLRQYEEQERQIELQEEQQDVDNMMKDELLAVVVARLMELEAKGAIPGVIDEEAELVEFTRVEADGEGTRGAIEANTR